MDGNSHFLASVERVDGGAMIESADDALRQVVSAVRRTGKKGKVSLTLDVSPNGEKGLEVTGTVKAAAPQLAFGKSFFFADDEGNLTRRPPALDLQYHNNTTEKSNG